MLFIRGLVNIPKTIDQTAITLGDFDGVHLGHQAIIDRLIKEAKSHRLKSVLICFEPQPAEFFQKSSFPGRILRLREKLKALDAFDIDYVLCLNFNKNLASLSAETFVRSILVDRLHCKRLVVGNDFRFGKGRKGDANQLSQLGEQYNFIVISEKAIQVNGQRISSTRIRRALRNGDFDLVKQLMGCAYQLSGKVRYGHGRGKSLGFPTANISQFHYKMATSGIFIVKVTDDAHQKWYGVTNLGTRPTFNDNEIVLEVYLLDFNADDLYGKVLHVEFLNKMRDELYFHSVNKLKAQIKKDINQARQWLNKFNKLRDILHPQQM